MKTDRLTNLASPSRRTAFGAPYRLAWNDDSDDHRWERSSGKQGGSRFDRGS